MSENREFITVVAGGSVFDGWTEAEVIYGLNRAARSFRLKVSEEGPPPAKMWTFRPGTAVEIYAGSDLLCTGHVDDYAPSYDKSSHEVTVTGRSNAADYVDSAAEKPGGLFENMTPEEIARELDRFGVGIGAKVPGDKIPYYQVFQGETAFRAAERACRQQGICLMGKADGSIELTNAKGAGRQPGTIILGRNILAGNGNINHAGRFSEHRVKGQGRSGHGEKSMRVEEKAADPGVERYRPRVVIAETETDPERAKKRAKVEATRLAGLSTRATYTLQSFRDDTGALWEANNLVFVDDPWLRIHGDMLIETVRLTQDNGEGSRSLLALVDPRAYDGEAPEQSDSDDVWKRMPGP